MQRSAVQGSPRMLGAVTGRWVTGAPVSQDVHPFRKSLAELRVGDSVTAGPRTVTQADVEHFAEFTGDTFYAHMDREAAQANPFFDDRVAHGYLVVSLAAGLFVQPDPGPVLANYGIDRLRFVKPVKPGDRIKVRLTCKSKSLRAEKGYGEVAWDTEITNQNGEIVASYDVLTMVSEQPVS
jgi:oxepin-CoA hydrolase/3-oxo-5,6-dehydrosuberyl-CoA semialdehyde dehydrogenase